MNLLETERYINFNIIIIIIMLPLYVMLYIGGQQMEVTYIHVHVYKPMQCYIVPDISSFIRTVVLIHNKI